MINKIKRWLKYKYRTYPIWQFWKNLKDKYDGMCLLCTHQEPCPMRITQQYDCYKNNKVSIRYYDNRRRLY